MYLNKSAAWLVPQRVPNQFPQKSLLPDERGFLRLCALESYDGIAIRAIERRLNLVVAKTYGQSFV